MPLKASGYAPVQLVKAVPSVIEGAVPFRCRARRIYGYSTPPVKAVSDTAYCPTVATETRASVVVVVKLGVAEPWISS
jgi:hypothetical protein